MEANGKFIVVEGIDGCGKTTQIARLADYYRGKGIEPVLLVEPTCGEWGKKALSVAEGGREDVSAEEELSYFMKDREENVEKNIKPALDAGRTVIQDRYYYSTAAYQGAIGFDWRDIVEISQRYCPQPDLVICLDIDPEVSLARIAKPNYFETAEYLRKVREIYREMRDLPNYHVIDADRPVDEVWAAIAKLVS